MQPAGSAEAEWSILLSDDAQLRALNAAYRGMDRVTDVLSFSLADEHHPGLLGDVVISVEQAARQAGSRGLEAELLRLLAHGLCHLLGHDHERPQERRRMQAAEALLLAPFGLSC